MSVGFNQNPISAWAELAPTQPQRVASYYQVSFMIGGDKYKVIILQLS